MDENSVNDPRWTRLINRGARETIYHRKDVYYWRVRKCRALGYQKKQNAPRGRWTAYILLKNGKARTKALGMADDDCKADGVKILDFNQALAAAETWFAANEADAAPDRKIHEYPEVYPEVKPPPPYTVGTAAKHYVEWHRLHRRGIYAVYSAVRRHIVEPLGDIPLSELTPSLIQSWFENLVTTPPIIGTSRYTGRTFGPVPTDPEKLRKRKRTANGILRHLKSILNRAYEYGFVDSNWAWANVRPFKNANRKPPEACLEKQQIVALLQSAREDARDLISGGLLSGCRAGDLMKMRVGDYYSELKRVRVHAGKTQNLFHVALSVEGDKFFKRLTNGRSSKELMFLRENGRAWSYYHFRVQLTKASEKANIKPEVTPHKLRHTFASKAAMAGIPLKVIASQLGHKTTAMVDRYYAHLSPDYVDKEIEEKMPDILS